VNMWLSHRRFHWSSTRGVGAALFVSSSTSVSQHKRGSAHVLGRPHTRNLSFHAGLTFSHNRGIHITQRMYVCKAAHITPSHSLYTITSGQVRQDAVVVATPTASYLDLHSRSQLLAM